MRIYTALTALCLLVTLTTASSEKDKDNNCKDTKCLAERLQAEPTILENWLSLANTMSIGEPVSVGEKIYEKPAHVVADAIQQVSGQAQNASMWATAAFYHRDVLLARYTENATATEQDPPLTIDGKEYTRLDMIKKAIDIDPNFARAWIVLSSHLRSLEDPNTQELFSNGAKKLPDLTQTVEVNGKTYNARTAIDEALRVDVTASGAWVELGRFLSAGANGSEIEKATVDGKEYTRRNCFEMAVQQGPNDFVAWTLLGLELLTTKVHYSPEDAEKYKTFTNSAEDNKVYTAQDALIKAIEIEPKFALAWARLGDALAGTSVTEVTIRGKNFSKQALFEQALRRDQYLATAWISLASSLRSANPREQPKSMPISGKRYTAVECLSRGLAANPRIAIAWTLLGQRLTGPQKAEINGEEFSRTDCFKNSAELDPSLPAAWAGIGTTLQPGKTVTVRDLASDDSKEYDSRAAFIKAISLKPDFGVMFMSLSATVRGEERVEIPGFKSPSEGVDANEDGTWTAIQLLVKACQMANPNAGENLGFLAQRMLERKMNEVEFSSPYSDNQPKTWTIKELLITALKTRPMIGNFWFALGGQLKDDATVEINGKEYGMFDCLVQTVSHSPRNSIAWVNIALLMNKNEMKTIKIRDEDYTSFQCFARALEIDPDQDRVWQMMTDSMPEPDSEVTIRGRVFKKKDILAELERQEVEASKAKHDAETASNEDGEEDVIPAE